MKSKLSPPCGKPVGAQVHPADLQSHDADSRRLVCYHCGVTCDMDGMRTERREFLEKLAAFVPRSGERARELREAKQQRIAKGAAPHELGQGEPLRVRFSMRKLGADSMTSHLDLVRKLPRIFRRAKIEAYYTEGYHPKPAIAFGPALPLGVQSLGEVFEIKLVRHFDDEGNTLAPNPAALLHKLNAVAEAGIDFVACEVLEDGSTRLGKSLHDAEYLVQPDFETPLAPEEIRSRLDAFAATESWPFVLHRKRMGHEIDLREIVSRLEPVDLEDLDEIETALLETWTGPVFRMVLRLEGTAHARPEEVLRAVFDQTQLRVPAVRLVRVGFTLASPAPGVEAERELNRVS
jgi:radical SAM-linked protein